MTHQKMHIRRNPKRGLILLIVLGMLAMFTLLAVTYVVTAGASRQGSVALAVKARNSNLTAVGTARSVLKEALRGTNNQKSLFYANSVIGDVYGPNPIQTKFGPYFSGNSARLLSGTGVNLMKLSINRAALLNGPLSSFENEYNSRIITIQEGPLAGQSYRILKYVGFVRNGSGIADPNIDNTDWSRSLYADPLAAETQFSILIDLDETIGSEFVGEYTDVDGSVKTVSLALNRWIATFGVSSLFYFKSTPLAVAPTTGTMVGYKLLINDAPFNSPGIGVEDIAFNPVDGVIPGYGNIDNRRLLGTNVKVPPALLTHYDYLQDPNIMALNTYGTRGVDGIGVTTRDFAMGVSAYTRFSLNGSSNEGIDVPDFRDSWLANHSFAGGRLTITPSYHRPEVVNYLTNLYGNPSSMTQGNVAEMLRLIDASTARVLSYSFGNFVSKNPGFRENDPRTVRLPSNFTWSSPPSGGEISALQFFVRNQIEGLIDVDSNGDGNPDSGSWDVDNNGDSFADSVWTDPGLPTVFAPDGRRLKPLAAVLFEDLDGRVNLNTSGDRVQGHTGFDVTTSAYYKRPSQMVPQGFGYGPADISLRALFNFNPNLLTSGFDYTNNPTSPNHFSFIDELTGGLKYRGSPIIFPFVNDRVSGIPRTAGTASLTSLTEREFHGLIRHDHLPAMPMARRSTFGMSYDRNGNPLFVNPPIVDADPYTPGTSVFVDETRNDRYESAAMENPISDDPLGLGELEAVLRRFDEDAASLPPRLRQKLNPIATGLFDSLFSQITTRSAELRYPNLAAAMKRSPPGASSVAELTLEGQAPGSTIPSYLRYIQMLHAQRYRNQTYPGSGTDDPLLSYAALSELFPTDFARGLRMDLNRPFGNGYDTDGDYQVDEPQELVAGELELYPPGTTSAGLYSREIKTSARKVGATLVDSNFNANPFPSQTRARLGSRQILARNLYCLAQLIIPRDYEFPGMSLAANALARARIRATAIAQWAVNVVDFRDADAAMTRFEFDILPFGSNTSAEANFGRSTWTGGGLPFKLAYWAPDRIEHAVPPPLPVTVPPQLGTNKDFVGVVWGMEMPELLMTETLAFHDKRLKDTDFDTSGANVSNGDSHLDQYRFPQASLFMELYNPRTTGAANNALIPGAPSSLYNAGMQLDLARLTPHNPPTASAWGRQPIWRVAISEVYESTPAAAALHPRERLRNIATNRSFENVTHQFSTELAYPMAPGSALAGENDINRTNTNIAFIEQHLGNGLRYDLSNPATPPPKGFDRFIWFTTGTPGNAATDGNGGTMGARVPDLLPSRPPSLHASSVYSSFSGNRTLAGGSFLVIGPRNQTSFGSLTHNQFTGAVVPNILAKMTVPTNIPLLSPSYQRIVMTTSGADPGVEHFLINNVRANDFWLTQDSPVVVGRKLRIKQPEMMICATPAPTGWTVPFPATAGVGVNISYPTPHTSIPYWSGAVPSVRLNSADIAGGVRTDNTPGFGSPTVLPDSWVDLSATTIDNLLPNEPLDNTNPELVNITNPALMDRRNTGTYENVRAAYLQRIADPELDYDPVSNPYITVDWMGIDLTVFNGEAQIGTDTNDMPTTLRFQSRYKNGALSPLATGHDLASIPVSRNHGLGYYSPMTTELRTTPPQSGLTNITVPGITPPVNPDSNFMVQLGYDKPAFSTNSGNSATTLGYCNVGYLVDPSSAANIANVSLPASFPTTPILAAYDWTHFDGFGPPVGVGVPTVEPQGQAFHGATARLAGATWFNRPFASPYELMMVPLTGPGNFGLHHSAFASVQNRELFGFVPSYQTANAWNVELPITPVAPATVPPTYQSYQSYWAKPEALAGGIRLADWPLLLEFVETQPPFIDANRYYVPDVITSLGTDAIANRFLNSFLPQGYTRQDGLPTDLAVSEPATSRGPSLFAPFNMKPSYVAAGKINLNTISFDSAGQSRALKAIEFNYLAGERAVLTNSLAASFSTSRQGYVTGELNGNNAFFANGSGVAQPTHPGMDARYPTRFVGAFRPAMSSNLAPHLQNPVANQKMRSRYGVEATLLRSLNPDTNTADMTTHQGILTDTPMLFDAAAPVVADELKATQPFVRMQRAMRLPNLVTNQSNVFAVWVTVSLHEYDPISGFGNEYIGETGLPERERQFFIVDRTIPVGFKPGEDLNVDRTILLQRKLP